MQKLTPFLWFESQAEEAMQFYTSLFPGGKIVHIKRYPDGITSGPMAGMGGKVLTGVFELFGQRFMALDGGPVFKPTGAVSFLVQCETQAEIDTYWNALTEGGDPSAQQCGWLKDKYGFTWQIVPDMARWLDAPDTEASGRAMQAMMAMKKIDIAALDAAFKG
jgi:predicted 3-demethylubiquinone-9 3-methyltransferase (glyoxalase superfamily)